MALLIAIPLSPSGEWEAFAKDDAAAIAYDAQIHAEALRHFDELERLYRPVYEGDPCTRYPLTLWLLVEPDGKVAEGWIEGTPPPRFPAEFVAAFEPTLKTWKLPPTPGRKFRRVRHSLGTFPFEPVSPKLACEARVFGPRAYPETDEGRRIKWWAVCREKRRDEVRAVRLPFRRPRFGETVRVTGCRKPLFLFQGVV